MPSNRILRVLADAVLAFTSTAAVASAQITTRNMSGTVVESTGGVVPGATVTLINKAQATKVGRVSRRSLALIGAAAIALVAMAAPVSAQLTTATVAGSVKDQQGAVIPGATAVLISETKGTRSAPAVTNSSGDFVFPNIAADTYTLEVTITGFKTLKRAGVTVSPGDRVALGQLGIEVGGLTEEVMVKGETPIIQANSGERSFAITTEAVTEPADLESELFQPDGVRARHERHTTASAVADRTTSWSIRSIGRHGQQRHGLAAQCRSDRRGEGPDVGLSGGVRPVERHAGHRP